MELINDVAAWAWARHHNILSWYIRPLFLLPFCFFAYRRSLLGITLTLVALATSMAWFPAPATPSPAPSSCNVDSSALAWVIRGCPTSASPAPAR